jgi:hypothetical protein
MMRSAEKARDAIQFFFFGLISSVSSFAMLEERGAYGRETQIG